MRHRRQAITEPPTAEGTPAVVDAAPRSRSLQPCTARRVAPPSSSRAANASGSATSARAAAPISTAVATACTTIRARTTSVASRAPSASPIASARTAATGSRRRGRGSRADAGSQAWRTGGARRALRSPKVLKAGPSRQRRFPADDPSVYDPRAKDTWIVFKIMGEFVEGFETLRPVWPAVSLFGGARVPRDHRYYADAQRLAAALAKAGFSIITGGGPGMMEAANLGARDVGRPFDRPQHQAALRPATQRTRRDRASSSTTSSCAR